MKPLTATPIKKPSQRAILFLKYAFHGDGIYRTTEKGSMKYKNTYFKNFYNMHPECIEIIDKGNDAPKGGQTGNFVHAIFTPDFYIKYEWYLDQLKKEKREREQQEREAKNRKPEQIKQLKNIFENDPEFKEKIKTRILQNSNKNWRSWVKLKVCKRLTSERFDIFELSSTEIREIAFSV
jgi:hypothetical protein